jgi:hypothetical protein
MRWAHEELAFCERLGAQVSGAHVYTGLIAKLEEMLRKEARETFSVSEAADYTGKSRRTIERQIARGELHNLGRKGKPILRKGDLVPKPRPLRVPVALDQNTTNLLAADVRSVASLLTGDGNDQKEKTKKRVA